MSLKSRNKEDTVVSSLDFLICLTYPRLRAEKAGKLEILTDTCKKKPQQMPLQPKEPEKGQPREAKNF